MKKNMRDEIYEIVNRLTDDNISKDEAVGKLFILYSDKLSLFQKNRLDLLNWAKSELMEVTNPKLGKYETPYRSDKMKFLEKVIKLFNNEI